MEEQAKPKEQQVTRWQTSLGVVLMFGFVALIGFFFSDLFAAILFSVGTIFGIGMLFGKMPNQIPGNNGRIPAIVLLVFSVLATGYCWMSYAEHPSDLSNDAYAFKGPAMPENAQPIYSKISTACPGFAEFKDAMTFDRMETNDGIWYDEDSRSGLTAIYVKITGDIDADPIARGNTCRYVLTKDEDRVVSQKEACAALCAGRAIALNGGNYEVKIP